MWSSVGQESLALLYMVILGSTSSGTDHRTAVQQLSVDTDDATAVQSTDGAHRGLEQPYALRKPDHDHIHRCLECELLPNMWDDLPCWTKGSPQSLL